METLEKVVETKTEKKNTKKKQKKNKENKDAINKEEQVTSPAAAEPAGNGI